MGRKTPQSRFVQNQDNKYSSQMKGRDKMEGRALFRAYEENNGKAREAVLNAIQNAAKKLNERASVKG
jgi:ribosome-binding protein aMBF1 (putative translation factor)